MKRKYGSLFLGIRESGLSAEEPSMKLITSRRREIVILSLWLRGLMRILLGGGPEKARAQAKAIGLLSTADDHVAQARIAEVHKDYEPAVQDLRTAITSDGGKAERYRELGLFHSR